MRTQNGLYVRTHPLDPAYDTGWYQNSDGEWVNEDGEVIDWEPDYEGMLG